MVAGLAVAPRIPFPWKRESSGTTSRPSGDTVSDWTPASAGVVRWLGLRKRPPSHSRGNGNPVRQRVALWATQYLTGLLLSQEWYGGGVHASAPIPFPWKRESSETRGRPLGDTVFYWTPTFVGVVWWQCSRECSPPHSRGNGNPVRQRVALWATQYLTGLLLSQEWYGGGVHASAPIPFPWKRESSGTRGRPSGDTVFDLKDLLI